MAAGLRELVRFLDQRVSAPRSGQGDVSRPGPADLTITENKESDPFDDDESLPILKKRGRDPSAIDPELLLSLEVSPSKPNGGAFEPRWSQDTT